MYLILRILVSPCFLLILLISSIFRVFQQTLNMIRYGGELLINEKEDKVYISSIYKELKNQYKVKENDKETNK
jgi:hypothetical protein